MKTGIKLIICAVMMSAAAVMASFTIAGFAVRQSAPDGMYILGEAEGNVAVFESGDRKHPVRVTDIELASLRESDRALIADGLPVETAEELAQLLEDLGS